MPKTLHERYDVGKARVLNRHRGKAPLVVLPSWYDPEEHRPVTRAQCVDAPRPCPWVSCRHHLYLDVTPKGGLQLNFPGLQPWQMVDSCALDVAEWGGAEQPVVAALINVTQQQVNNIERDAKRKALESGMFNREEPTE